MQIKISKFSGVAPKVTPRRLAAGMAQVAKNVDLMSRTVRGLKTNVTVKSGLTAAPVSSIYRFGQDLVSDTQYWFHWTADVDVAKGAISGDQTERTYFTHPTLGPMVTDNTIGLTGGSGDYPWGAHKLGVPAPTAAPVAAITNAGSTSSQLISRFWCFTYVTSWGEESAPSPVSNSLDIRSTGSVVRLTGLGTTPPAGYSHITAKRIYATQSGSLTTEFQLVDEIPMSSATYDASTDTVLQEVIPSAAWLPPPATAFGITAMANGIMLLFDGYDIYPSEAFIPYAYPVSYSQAVDYPIVGGAAVGSSAVILTTGKPYLLTGSDPSALSLVRLESLQACASKRSIAAVPGGVAYASPDGLIIISQSGQVMNATEQFFSRKEWQALVPSSMHGYTHDGLYIGFYNTGSTTGGFIYDPGQGDASFCFTDLYATAGYSDLVQDALYLKVGTEIVRWGAGNGNMTSQWRSGVAELPTPTNMACGLVRSTSYPVTFKMYGNGVLSHTQAVSSDAPFWMKPQSFGTIELEILAQDGEVTEAVVATTIEELTK